MIEGNLSEPQKPDTDESPSSETSAEIDTNVDIVEDWGKYRQYILAILKKNQGMSNTLKYDRDLSKIAERSVSAINGAIYIMNTHFQYKPPTLETIESLQLVIKALRTIRDPIKNYIIGTDDHPKRADIHVSEELKPINITPMIEALVNYQKHLQK